MLKDILQKLEEACKNWEPPHVPEDIPQGDMPGDGVWIGPQSMAKAQAAFQVLLPMLKEALSQNGKAVVSVSGGSGTGKTCVAALVTYYLNQLGVPAYTLSGDNYPKRIPERNDAERARIFRLAGVRGMLAAGCYNGENAQTLKRLQEEDLDFDPGQAGTYPWLEAYQTAGRKELSRYLGTAEEQEYDQLESVLTQFKASREKIWLKRMGREDTALWYEEKDFSGISVLVLEWTHGNSGLFAGVDIPIFLYNTPAETREYRLARGRDANADTAFITMVIELEQAKLEARAQAAKIIVSKGAEILSYEACRARIEAGQRGEG